MSLGYTKLFNSIIHSTIWSESKETRLLWITMLAMCDRHGCVAAAIPGLAKMAGITILETETALQKFMEPDKYSRTPDFEGRRIETIPGGWKLLNHARYRDLLSYEERKESNRLRQAEWRSKHPKNSVTNESQEITARNNKSPMSPHTEAKADTDTDKRKENNSCPQPKKSVLEFPTKGKPKGPFSLTEEMLAEFKTDFPAVDVLQECRNARAWCVSNPSKQKTLNGMLGFLCAWLSKIQNAPHANGNGFHGLKSLGSRPPPRLPTVSELIANGTIPDQNEPPRPKIDLGGIGNFGKEIPT